MLNRFQQSHPFTGALAPLSSADFRKLVSADFIWWTTLQLEFVAFGWLALELTDSVWMVSILGFFRSLPLLLLGPFGGAIADRYGRRKVILAAQATSMTVYALLAFLQLSGMLMYWHLLVCGLVLGAAWSLDFPSRRALLPDLVGKGLSVDAMLIESFSMGWAKILGPWTAGVLLAFKGPSACFVAMAAGGLAGLVILQRLSKQPIPHLAKTSHSPMSALGESLRYSVRSQPILGVLFITVIFNIFLFPYIMLMPVFARDVLGQGPVGLGLLGAASGIGSFLGMIILNRFRRSFTNGWILIIGSSAMCLSLFIFGRSEVFVLSWIMILITGIGQSWFAVMQSAIVLLAAADDMRQGVMGLVVVAIGADPVGKLWTGAIAQTISTPFAMSANSVLASIGVLAVWLFLPGLRTQGNTEETVIDA